MRWEEIDWENKIWNIPAARMKARRPHRVPLSDPAIALLRQLKERATGPYVFPSRRSPNKPIAEQDMIKFLRNTMRIPKEVADVHGLGRNPIRDWCSEKNDFDVAAVEMVLAHAFGTKITRAYFRSELLNAAAAQHLMDKRASRHRGALLF
jgi:integrase